MKNTRFHGFLTVVVVSTALLAQATFAAWPNWQQEKELFVHGTITEKDTTYDVIIVPGVKSITKNAKDGYVDAGKAVQEMMETGFWQKRGHEMKDGVKYSKEVVTDDWFKGIGRDFKSTRENNSKVAPGEIGSFFFPIVNWGWFAVKTLARTVWMPIGAAGGVTYSIVKPTLTVVWKPVVESLAFDTLTRGVIVPSVMYVWNGFAWVGSSMGNVPSRESPFVRIKRGGPNQKKPDLVIDKAGFEAIVQASILRALNDAEIARLQRRIDELEAQLRAQEGEKAKERADFEASPAEQARRKLVDEAWAAASVNLSDEAKDILLDDAKLSAFIVALMKQAGVENPAPETVAAIKAMITDNLKKMNAQMGKTAALAAAAEPAPLP